jgi:hypothetical protein
MFNDFLLIISSSIEAPCSRLQGMFCPTAVLRGDCKEFYNLWIVSIPLLRLCVGRGPDESGPGTPSL